MTHKNINPLFARPPYTVEKVPGGFYIANADGLNVLQFPEKPGAKFSNREFCEAVVRSAA
jgi:hypothetical protein